MLPVLAAGKRGEDGEVKRGVKGVVPLAVLLPVRESVR